MLHHMGILYPVLSPCVITWAAVLHGLMLHHKGILYPVLSPCSITRGFGIAGTPVIQSGLSLESMRRADESYARFGGSSNSSGGVRGISSTSSSSSSSSRSTGVFKAPESLREWIELTGGGTEEGRPLHPGRTPSQANQGEQADGGKYRELLLNVPQPESLGADLVEMGYSLPQVRSLFSLFLRLCRVYLT